MLTIETRPVARLIPYVRNARTHSGDQIAQIAGSIAEFGFVNPVLIGADDVIIAGHGRILAAEKLGLAEVPVIVLSHLSESQRRALVIADNRIAENAVWNDAMLVTAVGSLPIRTGRQFTAARKLGRTHQSVLVFVKGDPRHATEACGEVEFGEIEEALP